MPKVASVRLRVHTLNTGKHASPTEAAKPYCRRVKLVLPPRPPSTEVIAKANPYLSGISREVFTLEPKEDSLWFAERRLRVLNKRRKLKKAGKLSPALKSPRQKLPVPESCPQPYAFDFDSPAFASYYHILPSISVAFSNGKYEPGLVGLPHHCPITGTTSRRRSKCLQVSLTHAIRIVHDTARISNTNTRNDDGKGIVLSPGRYWNGVDPDTSVHHLTLVVPAPLPSLRRSSRNGRTSTDDAFDGICGTCLTHDQVVAVRDFLELALTPFSVRPREPENDVHVLITVPGQHPHSDSDMNQSESLLSLSRDERVRAQSGMDVLSVLACFRAYCNSRAPIRRELERLQEDIAGQYRSSQKISRKNWTLCRVASKKIKPWTRATSERFSSQALRSLQRCVDAYDN
ncbi:hypothetical protein D9613_001189 [Agrocybe pediades]|uniref:Uncharacterized protein n=1 Tax=Agrocybe pediades TaxID=84607 RepID=A0A8H4R196_9AGAR|nr:hypothetical protein D9613_001189 [Agrocybe pediades]